MTKRMDLFDIVIYVFITVLSFMCLYPFLMVVAGSLSSQSSILNNGYKLIPEEWTLGSYKALFISGKSIPRAYGVTILVTTVGTGLSLIINTMMGFVLARKEVRGRKLLNLYVLFTMLFTGGMVPWYIVCVNYLNLKNTLWALIMPMLVNAWYIFLIRNFMMSIPGEMYESAKIDGANDYQVFFRIYLSLAKPVLATVGLFVALRYWNDWWLGLMLVDKPQLQPLQLLLHTIISNIQFLKTMNASPEMQRVWSSVPTEGLRMAMVVVSIGPIVLLYPFVQKYFVKGIMVGAVKG